MYVTLGSSDSSFLQQQSGTASILSDHHEIMTVHATTWHVLITDMILSDYQSTQVLHRQPKTVGRYPAEPVVG